MGKGSTFGGPAGAVIDDDEELDMEDLQHALANPYFNLPPVVRRRVDALQNLQKQYLTLHKQYQAEVRELERKYQKMYDPVFDKRANVVSGDYEPTDAEAHVEKKEEEEGIKLREASPKDAEIKGIPQFWLGVLQSHQYVDSAIFETDEDALSYLRDIRYAELEGESEGFTLTFHFAENPYFTNTVLTKTYHMEQDELFGELQYDHATGTKIEWKAGKNLTVRQVKKKSKANKKKPARMVTVEEPADSFFSFFSPVQLPAPDDEEAELDEEDAQIMEMDFEIGCIIKDKLIPFSVLWYTGEAAEFDDEDDFGDEDDEDDDEDGDEDDEDEDDDEEDEPQPKKGGKKQTGPGHSFAPPPGAKPGAPGQPQQPECKQQ